MILLKNILHGNSRTDIFPGVRTHGHTERGTHGRAGGHNGTDAVNCSRADGRARTHAHNRADGRARTRAHNRADGGTLARTHTAAGRRCGEAV